MDCILNELSLNAQYDDIDDFSTYGVKPLSDVLRDVYSLGIGLLYKKSDFYNRRVTSSETFHDIIFSPVAKVNDYMRQMKSQLAKLRNGPYWDEEIRHDTDKSYFIVREDADDLEVTMTSVAEAQARQACLISFTKSDFLFDKLFIKIQEDGILDSVFNVWNGNQLREALFISGQISMELYFKDKFRGKLSFDGLDSRNGFNLLSKENVEMFISGFEKFEKLSWPEIVKDEGFDYKEFSKNRRTSPYFSNEIWQLKVYKFRIDRKIRCFGNTIDGVFHVLRFDLNHELSDLG
ncbi:hypothetical protein QR305_01884 [Bacteroides finegoldii]|uniref:Uncharacterized protein n=1 Tax=Bacteroides finegoldii CL09T03C10 TaxID=997888 RepID=K5CQE6_9BACE|nr:hypothetical protein [Bacteroides finegoldii]EKJ91625.1 hypothetical protein HMPREF1057_00460 [Bacteroides finegoldii CL09T03C10]